MQTISRGAVILGFVLLFALSPATKPAFAQQPVDASQTLPPFGGFSGSNFDIVSLQNGNLHISIPLVEASQRGGKTMWYKFVYDTPTYTSTTTTIDHTLITIISLASKYTGWRVTDPLNWVSLETQAQITCVAGKDQATSIQMQDPEGVVHPFGVVTTGGICPGVASGPALDASGMFLGPGLILKDGSTLNEDTNGNIFGSGTCNPISCPDTLNRLLLVQTTGATVNFTTPLGQTVSGPQYLLFTYTDSNGASQEFRVDYEALDLSTGLCGSLVPPRCEDINKSTIVPSRLTLPTGAIYQFTWVNDSQAQLQEVQLPAGGSISYTYGAGGGSTGQGGSNSELSRMAVKSRTVTAGGTNAQWTYTGSTWDSSGDPETTVTDPNGNAEVHQFTFMNPGSSVETNVISYSGSSTAGTVMKTVATTYGHETLGSGNTLVNIRPIQQTITLDNGQTRMTQTDYDTFQANICVLTGSTLSCFPQTVSRMDPTAVREYDYGAGAPGALLRTTNYTYLHTSNSAYATANIVDRVTTKTVLNGSGTQVAQTTFEYDNYGHTGQPMQASGAVQHDSTFSTSYTLRGNVTAVSLWRNTDGASLTTTKQFDDAGNVLSTIDPLGNKTAFSFTDSWSNTGCVPSGGNAAAYLTTSTNALNQATSHSYNSCTGTRASTKDPNAQTTTFAYDAMGRTTLVNYPDGGQTSNSYNDTQIPLTVTTTKKITSSRNYTATDTFDGLGRMSESLVTDPQGNIETVITYDAIGRKSTVSNPYRQTSDSTYGITTYQYDALNRTTLVIPPDGTSTSDNSSTKYCGSSTLVTDEAGHWRRSTADGLGRLIEVDEPNSTSATVGPCPASGNPTWVTTYAYDALNNLTSVVQGGSHNRSFVYDSLSHLTTSTNPEPGAVTYTYDSDGNVLTKKDARSITITYAYDKLNRLLTKTYSNSDPTVSYGYDGNSPSTCSLSGFSYGLPIGRRTGMCDAAGSEMWRYDSMGRELAEQRTSNSITKSAAYTYNLDGTLATLTYPSGRTITYTTDPVERPSEAQDVTNAINYATGTCSNGPANTGACYAPQGAVALIDNGASLSTSHIYDDRLQPCWIYATTGTALASTTKCTGTATTGTVLDMKYNFALGTADNGNVMGITNDIDNTRSQTFTYDQVNRIVTAQTPSSWSQSFTYDEWANLTTVAATGTAPPLTLSVNANNQITSTGFSYDAAANETSDVTSSYVWNAESELKTAASVNYTYDGDGDRVEKSNGKIYWYGAGSEILDESDLSGNITDEYIFFGGKRIARRDSSGNVVYYVADLLGSSRVVTNATGGILDQSDFYPYGGEHVLTASSGNTYKFEGKERDAETNNDDFGARYYSSTSGRFLSADWSAVPAPVPYANLTNPQTLNLYAMVSDNPESFADLDGHCAVLSLGTCSPAGISANAAAPGSTPPHDCAFDALACYQGDPSQETGCLANHALCNSGELVAQAQSGTPPTPTNPDGTPKPPVDNKGVGLAGLVATTAIEGSELGPADVILVGGVVTIYLYKNKEAAGKAMAQIAEAARHINLLMNDPGKDPRNHWRKEIRDRLADAQKWTDRMSKGMKKRALNGLIKMAQEAVPED